ncbi:MAG: WYL domain-containing protein [Myxococcota bacterium]|nr:WYL domain-containing protein [Myxococcota bacterium]
MSQRDRLGRLLFIVPYVANRDGVPVGELAEMLGVKPAQIEADIGLLSMVGQPPLTPDHLIDLYIEDETVFVDLDQSLDRPLRLTHDEAQALAVGIQLVGPEGEALRDLVERMMEHLNPADRERVLALVERVSVGEKTSDSFAPVLRLREAVAGRRVVSMDYYSASSDRHKVYKLWPLSLISHSGVAYVVALDQGADGQEKLFRLDRVGEVSVLDETFETDVEVDLEKFRTPELYGGTDGAMSQVVFRAEVAAEARERFAERDLEEREDGSVSVRLLTSSPAWLARWVLPFGLDAEVEGPHEQRELLGKLCREAADAYSRPVG